MRRFVIQFAYSTAVLYLSVGCSSKEEIVNDLDPSTDTRAVHEHENLKKREPGWDGVSRLKSAATLAELHQIADDATVEREKRAEAIFSLFANHVKLPQGAAALSEIVKCKNWLNDTNLYGVYMVAGMIPVELTFEDTVFCLHLFPVKKDWSDWVIYFRLSGGSGRTADEARAFLRGAAELKGDPKLLEFALCFPDEGALSRIGRIERFTEKGIAVFQP
jgi:hypothetical protein